MLTGVATVNEISSCLRANGSESDSGSSFSLRASALASTALAAAALVGTLTACLLWSGLGAAALATTGARESLLPLASSYLVVRAAGVPLALVSGVCQAALLAQRDARAPARAVALQVVANVFGDWLLVSRTRLGLPRGGARDGGGAGGGVRGAAVFSDFGAEQGEAQPEGAEGGV